MTFRHWVGILLILAFAVSTKAEACGNSESPAGVLQIGLSDSPPFVILKEGLPPSGLSVELWRRVEMDLIAEGLITSSQFVRCDAIDDLNTSLAEGSLDLALSPLTVTPRRLNLHDMSRQYFLSGLTVATRESGEIAFEHALDVLVSTLFRPGTMRAIILFLIFNFVLALLIRLLLRDARARPDIDHAVRKGGVTTYVDPFLEAIERTLGLKGIDEASYNLAGRLLEIFMAIIGAVLSAALLGVLTSAFVSAIGQTQRLQIEDLADLRVGVVAGSTAEDYLSSPDDHQAAPAGFCKSFQDVDPEAPGCRLTQTITQLVDPLASGEIDVVLGDWAELTYLSRVAFSDGEIRVEDVVYRNEPLAWGYGKDMSALSDRIDRALIEKIRAPGWRTLVQQHLGDGSISPD